MPASSRTMSSSCLFSKYGKYDGLLWDNEAKKDVYSTWDPNAPRSAMNFNPFGKSFRSSYVCAFHFILLLLLLRTFHSHELFAQKLGKVTAPMPVDFIQVKMDTRIPCVEMLAMPSCWPNGPKPKSVLPIPSPVMFLDALDAVTEHSAS